MAGRTTSPRAGGRRGPHAGSHSTAPAPGLSPSPPLAAGSGRQPCPPLLPQRLLPPRPADPVSSLNAPGGGVGGSRDPEGSGLVSSCSHAAPQSPIWEDGEKNHLPVLPTSPRPPSSVGPTAKKITPQPWLGRAVVSWRCQTLGAKCPAL